MKNEPWFKEILSNMEYWKDLPLSTFYYHPLYKVGVGKETNLDYTFGKKRKLPLKNLRKFKFFTFQAQFPEDSVIFLQPSRQRIIISSQKHNRVYKISTSPSQLSLKDAEIDLLKDLEKSEFAPHSAKLVDYGDNWIVTTFCPNRDSVNYKTDKEKYLLDHSDTLIMEPMAKFYRSRGLQKLNIIQWKEEVRAKLKNHPLEQQLVTKIDKIKNDFHVLKSQIHLDLHSGNFLIDNDHVTIIDWEISHPGLVLIDFFDFYRRFLNKDKFEKKLFSEYLKGKKPASGNLLVFYNKYKKWLKQFDIQAEDLRFIILLYSLERTAIYWEKWKENRLSDQKGFEKIIIDSLDLQE